MTLADLFDKWWESHASGKLADGPWPMSREDIKETFLAGCEAGITSMLETQWELIKGEQEPNQY